MKIIQTSKKGQILIPKSLREKYGIDPGSKVLLIESDEGLVVKAAPADPIETANGFLRGGSSLREELLSEHREELKREQKRGSR